MVERQASLKPVRPCSNSSLRISLSRSSSRSFRDDFDYTDFPCPFDVEYDDVTYPSTRQGSFDKRGDVHGPHEPSGSYPKKTLDAVVGALVSMLKKASPLRQDVSEPSIPEICWNHKNKNHNKPVTPHDIAAGSSGIYDGFRACSGFKDNS